MRKSLTERIAESLLRHKKAILAISLLIAVISAVLMMAVNINYDLSDYLPESAPSTMALAAIEESFGNEIPNLNVYIPDVTIPEALEYKEKLKEVGGVGSVLWLDDVTDILKPLEMEDKDAVEAWYKDGGALFVLSVDTDNSTGIIYEIRKIAGEGCVMSGEAVNQAAVQSATMNEISKIMLYAIPIVLIILLIATNSWFEPVLFVMTIGAAILINEGTNVFFGEVSYITRASSAILQLAVSIDYAVFLLHSYARFRKDEALSVGDAMKKAMVYSFPAIAASAATTVFGFLALTLMKFKIGPDMGVVLAKGVFLSYICVMVLLPVLAVCTTKLMDKTRHRPLLPSFKGFSKWAVKICIPLAVVIVVLFVPSFLAQSRNEFLYGSSGMHAEDSAVKRDANYISDIFGESLQMVLLVPEGSAPKEKELTEALESIPDITSVISYSNQVGNEIPQEILTEEQLSQLRKGGYSRVILNASVPDEGEKAFAVVEAVRKKAGEYYEDDYHLLGQNVINYDLKETITKDYLPVTLASILAIGMVILVTFKSVSIPLILLLTIEGAIWINLGLPYFAGRTLNYIGYQIISTVQLGATVDYGILFVKEYLNFRKDLDKKDAARAAISITAGSILSPAGILTAAGLVLGFVSTNGIISELGTILGRGAVISAAMVLLFLPALLIVFDGLIRKTTFNRMKTNVSETDIEN